jgi:hypothetical protein
MDYVLWELSFANMNMLLATIPVYETKKEKEEVKVKEVGGIRDIVGDVFK